MRGHHVAVDGARGSRGHALGFGYVEIVVVGIEIGAPVQPHFACVRGQQVFLLEAVLQREPLGPLADQKDVVRVLEHEFRDLGRRLDPLERAHRPRALGGAVHARRVELHDAVGVRQPAIPHGVVVRVELLDLHALDRGVERVRALHQHVERLLHGAQAVGARHRDGLGCPTAGWREWPRRPHRKRNVTRSRRRDADGRRGEEHATRQEIGHGNTPRKLACVGCAPGRALSTCSP